MQLHTIVVPGFFVAGVIGLAFWQRAAVVVVHGIRLAQQSLHDDIQGAERPLDAIPRWARFGALEGAVLLVRAQIRWLWGDLHACEDFATRAIRADRFAVRTMYSTTTSEALAIRALARAATNRLEDARGDLKAVDTDTAASFSARAYSSLARAVVLAYDKDASGLRDHLRRTRDAIAVVAHPREVLLLRALERRERGVPPPYRSHAGMAMSAGGHAWLRTVVPSLVEQAEGEAAQAEGEAAQATAESQDPGPASVPRPPSPWKSGLAKVGAMWVLLIIMFVAIWKFVSPDVPPQREPVEPAPVQESDQAETTWNPLLLAPVAIVLLTFLFVLYSLRKGVRRRKQLTQARWDATTGRSQDARDALDALTGDQQPLVAAQAYHQLAQLSLEEGAIEEANRQCGRALVSLAGGGKGVATVVEALRPPVLSDQAVLHAAQGAPDKARETLALLDEQHPYAAATRAATFRVDLTIAVKGEDWNRAVELASARPPDLGLPLRDEILARLVVATHAPADSAEIAAIREELDKSSNLRKYARAISPRLLERFDRL